MGPVGCLTNPHQQSTNMKNNENMDHDDSKTLKIIPNGSLDMILCVFEQDNKYEDG